MNYEQTIKQIIETTPSWEKDGGGIRGRTIAPIISGTSLSNGIAEFVPQQFNQQKNEAFQRAREPIADLTPIDRGSGGNTPHPWQVLLRTNEDEIVEFKVDINSRLYSGINSYDNIAITGLDFWAPASSGYLYLFGVITGGICTEASIQGPEEIPSDRVDFVGDVQNSFAAVIAYLYTDEDGNLAIQQKTFQDFTIADFCVNGKPAKYPMAI
jgi:hypothetical protein